MTSTAQLLQGMNAGLMVSQTSGQPGQEGMLMRIRGIGTLNNSAPLVIVDGFESSIANVSPDDIESVSVLKDAASCAIYGNRGANGVVLVTTKTGGGNAGKFNISYNGMVAFNRPANHFELISNYADYMELMNESAENIDGTLPFSQAMIDLWREKEKDPNGIADSGYPNYVAYPNTDWMKAMFENNVYHKHNLSASGSSGGTKYLMSFSYVNNPGVVARTGTERFQLRTNVSSQVTKWLEIGTKLWGYEGTRELNDFGGASDYMSAPRRASIPTTTGNTAGWRIPNRAPRRATTSTSSTASAARREATTSTPRSSPTSNSPTASGTTSRSTTPGRVPNTGSTARPATPSRSRRTTGPTATRT